MRKSARLVLWFREIDRNDVAVAGGKGANLGEMYSFGVPVPNGFVVSSKAYYDFIDSTSLKQKILTELSSLDIENSKELLDASRRIETAILAAEMPSKFQKEIRDYYHNLCGEYDRYVAVRSSATAEDLPEASFAGQQETFLNVKGYKDVTRSVQKCWASLFEPRAIFYRTDKGFDHLKVGIAVPVQLMVQSEVSGILFTVNPLTNNRNEVSIEAVFGLGQPIVSGEITPDQYLVDKATGEIIHKTISRQTWQLSLSGKTDVSRSYQEEQKLSDLYIEELARIGVEVEKHYGGPQDIEWALQDGKLYIVQSRPVTTLKAASKAGGVAGDVLKGARLLLEGLGASPGVSCGRVRVIPSPKDISKVKAGDVLVAEMTNPDYVPAMRRAVAVVTDKGGRTSHAAIVSRELGIPAVVGTSLATRILKNDEVITVDGAGGRIYEGDVVLDRKAKEEIISLVDASVKTATKLYVNLAEPDLALDVASRNVDGVGLLRAEFMIAGIGTHPRKFVEDGRQKEFIDELSAGLREFAARFDPRPVVYRTTDFRSNEYKNLKGGHKYEKDEFNPMIGFRGASRYLEDSEVFAMEIEAVKKVRNKLGYKNLHVMLPFVRTVDQLRRVKKLMASFGLRRSGLFKLWMMVEVPSNVLSLEDFISEGIDGVSIGTNDLTMLILGVDRDNERVADVYNELDHAVLTALEEVVTTCAKHKVTCSICGQAPSVYPELVEKLVEWGITSVSVSPDVIDKTRRVLYDAERKVAKRSEHKKVARLTRPKR
ncbi:phosphoenolpyruvate synthase [candidate division WWE3 bacterium]|nr:phosphoenolpyruvate synthase [candidate division WWE3 bacterium]